MKEPKSVNCKDWPVMAKQCATCVFKLDSNGHWVYPDLAQLVEERMMRCSQVCHHPKLKGQKETHLCRGTRDRQIKILHWMGFLPEATDAAWQAMRKKLGC